MYLRPKVQLISQYHIRYLAKTIVIKGRYRKALYNYE